MVGRAIAALEVRRITRSVGLALAMVLAAPATSHALGGDLDPSFGGDGKVTAPAGIANAVALQADGKVVAAGFRGSDLAVARYGSDGGLDPTFGGDGVVTTGFGRGCFAYANAVLVQGDGKIVAIGLSSCRKTGFKARFTLVRYEADGSRDAGFGKGGKVTTRIDGRACSSHAEAAALQADGKIVAAGEIVCREAMFAVARYEADGSLDPSFRGDGMTVTDFTPGFDSARGVAVQSNGRIVVAGSAASERRGERFALARYRSGGRLDPSFGGDGKVMTRFPSPRCGPASADAVAIQGDGKIVAAGVAHCGGDPAFGLVRYTADGSRDPSFSRDGRVATLFQAGNCADHAFGVAIQGDGKIVAAGVAGCANPGFGLARYRTGGRLDPTFGGNGKVTTTLRAGDCFEHAEAVAIQADGKIVAAGGSTCLRGRFAVARYLAA